MKVYPMHDDALKARNLYKKIGKKKICHAINQRHQPAYKIFFSITIFAIAALLSSFFSRISMFLWLFIGAIILLIFKILSEALSRRVARLDAKLEAERSLRLNTIEEKLYLYGVYQEIKRSAKLIDYLHQPEAHYTNAAASDKHGKVWRRKIPHALHSYIDQAEKALKQTLPEVTPYYPREFLFTHCHINDEEACLTIDFQINYQTQLFTIFHPKDALQPTHSYHTSFTVNVHHYLRAKEYLQGGTR
ncbi:hypothetical protein [Entomospira culicis]|uniref:Uncharacterized protein n=1 Tax=Entomospira culicis TaxID=2719989 RepID=A0A968KZ53_9SPIO|nr:hypothetical protein [Entomospira culicis]NIZ18746.1 hypothetical protein [Entomospira culicis]NIZ68961.1 hypothetical protein [Entomospira culicis]WDI37553.1 hypothetical protein PVA46_01835 [Entomospira culicis]WDI39181.1 hypothetical protein PVA47_01840 [Entomospira culicis]